MNKIEAVLFASGKAMSEERIGVLCALSADAVTQGLAHLAEKYKQHDGALRLMQRDNGWKLAVKDEYIPLVSSIVESTELDRPLMETLAVIAWKYPVVQSDVVKMRGSGAYDHMRSLVEQGFVAKERSGRTYILKLTKKFFAYFDLPSEEAKQAFLSQMPPELLQDASDVEKEVDEAQRLQELADQEQAARDEIRQAMDDMKD